MDEDPVVEELDVCITTQLASYLKILQLPGNYSELEQNITWQSTFSRYKPNHQVLELHIPLDSNHSTYSTEQAKELALAAATGKIKLAGKEDGEANLKQMSKVLLVGSPVASNQDTFHFVATRMENVIYLTPVDCFMTMKTSLPYLDEADQKTKSTSRKIDLDAAGGQEKGASTKSIQVQYRKRETEEQLVARLSSYSHLQRQLEEESWVEMTHYHPNSPESSTVCERLISLSSNNSNTTNSTEAFHET